MLLVSCVCCSIASARGYLVLSDLSIFYELFPLDSSADITQTTDINEKSEKFLLTQSRLLINQT